MGYVITFLDYTPGERFDDTPWTTVRFEESEGNDGPWTLIDAQALNPVDADPANPQSRDLTTAQATLLRGWYRLVFADAAGNAGATAPRYHDASPTPSTIPSVVDIRRRTPNVSWAERGYPAPDAPGEVDPLEPLIPEAIAELHSLIGVDATDPKYASDKRAPLITRALRMLVAFNAGVETDELLDTAVDFDMIQSLGASVYNETRRAISANRTVVHPWPALNKLLLGVLYFSSAGQPTGNGPALSVDGPGNPPPGEWHMDPHRLNRPGSPGIFEPPVLLPRHYY